MGSLSARGRGAMVLVVGVLRSLPAEAAEAPDRVRLSYEVEGVEACLSTAAFREEVLARTNEGALDDQSATELTVTIARAGERLRATIALSAPDFEARAQRIETDLDACGALGHAAALAAALTIASYRARPQPEPTSRSPPQVDEVKSPVLGRPPPPQTRPQVHEVKSPRRLTWEIGAGMTVAVGVLPEEALGVGSDVSLVSSWWRVSLGWETYLSVFASSPQGGGASVSLRLLHASACVVKSSLVGCLTAAGGDMRSAGSGLREPRAHDTGYAALGAYIGAVVPVSGPFFLRIGGEARGQIVETTVRVREESLWTSPRVAALASGSIVVQIP